MSSNIIAARLIGLVGLSNLAFWLLWPASIVRVADLGWGPTSTGLFGSAAWGAVLLAIPVASWLLPRVGSRTVAIAATALVVVAALGVFAEWGGHFEWLWTGLLGFGTGLRWIACDSWIADVTPPERIGRILSLGEMVVGLGFAAGPAIVALLDGVASQASVALAAASIGVASGLLVIGIDDPIRQAARPTLPAPTGSWLEGLPLAAALMVLASAFLGGLNESGFAGIATLISAAGGGDAVDSLAAAAAVGVGSFVAQYALGSAADRWGGCKVLLACAALLTGALLCLAALPATLPASSLVIGGVGGGLYTVAVVFGLQAQKGAAGRAAMIGSAAFAYTTGTLAAPTLAGLGLSTFGLAPTLIIMAAPVAALFAAILILQAWRWTDPSRGVGPACAFRVSPKAFQ